MTLDDQLRGDGWVEPMLAAAGTGEFTDEADWAFEMKWDGVRVIAQLQQDGPRGRRSDGFKGSVTLRSRNGLDITRSYPEVVTALEELAVGSAVLDGEIVALDAEGRPSFRALQRRIHLTRPVDVQRARAEVPVQVMLFDVLALDGRSLLDLSYEDRHELLIELVPADPPGRAQVPPRFVGDLEAALETSRVLQLEGVVAKRLGSRYLPGSRGGAWIKIKHQRTCEVIIGGWRIGHGRREGGIGSLAMGLPDGDQLRYVGRVGSGLSDRDLQQVLEVLQPMERSASPFMDVPAADAREMRWVEPLLVGEVTFAGWSAQRRLWHPTWRGWRPDKDPGDVRDPDDPDVP